MSDDHFFSAAKSNGTFGASKRVKISDKLCNKVTKIDQKAPYAADENRHRADPEKYRSACGSWENRVL